MARTSARKKTPAQLDREIAEVLRTKEPGLTAAQRAYVELFEQDVRAHPAAYKASVQADPAAYATQLVEGLDDADVRQFTRDLRQEMRQVSRLAHATMATGAAKAEELDRAIAPTLGRTRAQIVRAINSIVRAADGRNVYLIRQRLGSDEVRRVTRARTKGRGMEVYLLDSGNWIGVLPEMGDRIDVR